MIKLENTVLPSAEQWEAIIRGMRNPKNSWDRSDSVHCLVPENGGEHPCSKCHLNGTAECHGCDPGDFVLGHNDHKLMMSLAKGGPVHAKYRRMIPVYVDITAPLYWWKEFDTYKVGTVANSCSTMHKIHAKEFTLEDFSCEHLIDGSDIVKDKELRENLDVLERKQLEGYILVNGEHDLMPIESFNPESNQESVEWLSPVDILEMYVIGALNFYRDKYLETKDKKYWWQMIQLLPTSYNQKRTVMLNYEVLHNIYISRKNHKLPEWHEMCAWIENLPYSEIITLEEVCEDAD